MIPAALRYGCQQVLHFSKNKFPIYPTQTAKVQSGQTISFVLPTGSVNLSTLKLFGTVSYDALNYLPKNLESMFTNIQVQINGTAIVPGNQANNLLENIKLDWLANDKQGHRWPQINTLTLTDNTTVLNTSNSSNITSTIVPGTPGSLVSKSFCLDSWGSVLETIQPSVINTQILGEVRIQLTIAQPWINVVSGYTSNSIKFRNNPLPVVFNDLRATVEMWSLADTGFNDSLNAEMARAPLELPFTYYTYFSGSPQPTTNQTLKMPVNSKCVSHVISGFLNGATYQSGFLDTTTWNSSAFTCIGTDVLTSVYTLNSVNYPTQPVKPFEIYENNLDVLNIAKKAAGTYITPSLKDLASFKNSYFTHMHSFDIPSKPSQRLLSGTDTSGNQVQLAWSTVQDGAMTLTCQRSSQNGSSNVSASYYPFSFVAAKGVLNVSPNRVLSVSW
jgi:hypothetical protein